MLHVPLFMLESNLLVPFCVATPQGYKVYSH